MTPDERATWLAKRRLFVGASEAGALLGISPWRASPGPVAGFGNLATSTGTVFRIYHHDCCQNRSHQ